MGKDSQPLLNFLKNKEDDLKDSRKPLQAAKWLQNLWNKFEGFFTGDNDLSNQKELIDYQDTINEKWWNKKNAYDSTIQQLARWTNAGGNPNAFFGGQNIEGAASVSAGSGASVGSTIGLPLQAATTALQQLKAYWDAKKTKAEAEGQEITNGTLKQLNETTIEEIKTRIKLQEKQGNLYNWEARQIEQLLPGLVAKNTAELSQIEMTCNNLIAEGDEIRARTKNLNANTKKAIWETYKLKWEKTFRDDFGIDPNSQTGAMIVQGMLSGKSKNVLTELFNTIKDVTNWTTDELLNTLDKNGFKGIDDPAEWISKQVRKRMAGVGGGAGGRW